MLNKEQTYYKISEIARQYQVSADALRYYEAMGLITPVRGENGYRLYTLRDIWRLNVITNLRDLGFSIERIRAYFDEGTIDSTQALLEEEQRIVDERLEKLQNIKARIEEDLGVIRYTRTLRMDEIKIKHFGVRHAVFAEADFSEDEEMDRLMRILTGVEGSGIDIIGNSHLAAVLAPLDQDDHLYRGAVMFRDDGPVTIPAGDYLSVCYSGKWNSRFYADKLIKYAAESGMELDGMFMDIIWIDVHTAIRVSDHISEVQVRIRSH